MRQTHILDSYAVLALLTKEPGSEDVRQLMRQAQEGETRLLMTWVNVGEVAYIIERRWGRDRAYEVLGSLEATDLEIVPVGREVALRAAAIKAEHPLAFADAMAAALAINEGAVLVTGDPEFERLEGTLSICWLPRDG